MPTSRCTKIKLGMRSRSIRFSRCTRLSMFCGALHYGSFPRTRTWSFPNRIPNSEIRNVFQSTNNQSRFNHHHFCRAPSRPTRDNGHPLYGIQVSSLAPAPIEFWVRFADSHTHERNQGTKARAPCVKVPGSSTGPIPRVHWCVMGRLFQAYKPRLVVSHSTCPPLSLSPHADSFVLGLAVINNKMALLWKEKEGVGSV
jgi:hypothetical protein